jgi:arsenite-transporting ATPase
MKGDVQLDKLSDELIVRVGSMRRRMPLPRQVAASKEVRARLEGQHLFIHFKGEPHGKREA